MRRRCTKCEREEPDHIYDPHCSVSGYCNFVDGLTLRSREVGNPPVSGLLTPEWSGHNPSRSAALFFLHDRQSADALKQVCISWLDAHRLALV